MDFTYNSVLILALQLQQNTTLINARCYNKKKCVCVAWGGYMGTLYFLLTKIDLKNKDD